MANRSRLDFVDTFEELILGLEVFHVESQWACAGVQARARPGEEGAGFLKKQRWRVQPIAATPSVLDRIRKVVCMAQRGRPGLSASQKAELWQ
jgi:hypothetical protein